MEIKIEENTNMNHHQIKLVVHPRTKHIAKKAIDKLEETLESIPCYDEYNNMYFIPVISIIYIEIVDHHVYAYTHDQIYYLHCYSLKEFIKNDIFHHFCQINSQTAVNIDYVLTYHIDQDCRRKVFLENGEVLIVNRSYKDKFEKVMKKVRKIVK